MLLTLFARKHSSSFTTIFCSALMFVNDRSAVQCETSSLYESVQVHKLRSHIPQWGRFAGLTIINTGAIM